MRREYTTRRSLVLDRLGDLHRVRALPPDGGFFAMVDVRNAASSSNEVRKRLLNESGVVVIHGGAYGRGAEGMLRGSFASGGAKLAAGLERLRSGLAAL
jgi:aspartate aminotransferase